MALTKVPSNLDATIATTQSASDNSTNVATTAYVTTAIANLVDGAPSTLNTLDEIAAALNDDAALNTTLTNSIATKLPLAGGTMSGALNMGSQNITNAGTLNSRTITITDGTTNGASTIGGASDNLLLDTNADTGITIRSGANSDGVISFASPTDHNVGQVYYEHNNDAMVIKTNDAIALTMNSSQNATFAGNVSVGGSAYTTSADLNLLGDGLAIKNDKNGSNNNWSLIQNTATSGTANLAFTTGTGVALTLNHDTSATFGGTLTSGRLQPNEHIIFQSSTGYLQFPGSSSRAWAMASSGGTSIPGTQSATFGIHHWSGSAWSNPINITSSGKLAIGTDNPDRDLHIKGSGSDVGIQIEKDGVGEFRVAYDSTGPYLYAENTSHPIRMYTGNQTRWKLHADGAVDHLNSPRFVSTKNSTEHQFEVNFSHGTAYQYVDLILENTWWGSLEVHLTGTYSNQNMPGLLAKRFALGLNNNNNVYANESSTISALGFTNDNFHIGECVWDATLNKYKIPIGHRTANGNLLHIKVLAYSAESTTLHDKAQNFTLSSVYTSGSSYPERQSPHFGFYAYLSASQQITSTMTKIAFNTEQYDYGNNHSNGTFTAPENGLYQFGMNFLCYSHTSGVLNPYWYKGNTAYSTNVQQGPANASHTAVNSTIAIPLGRGDTVEPRISGSVNSNCYVYGGQAYWYGYKVGAL